MEPEVNYFVGLYDLFINGLFNLNFSCEAIPVDVLDLIGDLEEIPIVFQMGI